MKNNKAIFVTMSILDLDAQPVENEMINYKGTYENTEDFKFVKKHLQQSLSGTLTETSRETI